MSDGQAHNPLSFFSRIKSKRLAVSAREKLVFPQKKLVKKNILIVLQPEFVAKVNLFLEVVYMALMTRGGVENTKEEFKRKLWQLLKAQWAKSPEHYDQELYDNLPDELKDPLLSIVVKEQRGTFKLDNGYEVPMYNYGGKLEAIPNIPNILCHIGSHTVVSYNEGGKIQGSVSPNAELVKAFKQYPRN